MPNCFTANNKWLSDIYLMSTTRKRRIEADAMIHAATQHVGLTSDGTQIQCKRSSGIFFLDFKVVKQRCLTRIEDSVFPAFDMQDFQISYQLSCHVNISFSVRFHCCSQTYQTLLALFDFSEVNHELNSSQHWSVSLSVSFTVTAVMSSERRRPVVKMRTDETMSVNYGHVSKSCTQFRMSLRPRGHWCHMSS